MRPTNTPKIKFQTVKFLSQSLWTPPHPVAISRLVFRRSSAVEQLTVNQLVVGSIPTAGAKFPSYVHQVPVPFGIVMLIV